MRKRIFISAVLFLFLVGVVSPGVAYPLLDFQEDTFTYFPLISKADGLLQPGTSGIRGRIYNASSQEKNSIVGASVCLNSDRNCVNSDLNGEYQFVDIAADNYRLFVKSPNYFGRDIKVTVQDNETVTVDVGLVERLELGNVEMRVTVEWLNQSSWPGSDCKKYPEGCPTDLDAHIWGSYTGGMVHYFQDVPGDCLFGSAICLESAASNGPGPEVVTIRSMTDPNAIYYYGIHNIYYGREGVPLLSEWEILVQIYRLDGTYYDRYVSDVSGDSGNFWYLFSLSAETGDIDFHNCLTNLPVEGEFPECSQ